MRLRLIILRLRAAILEVGAARSVAARSIAARSIAARLVAAPLVAVALVAAAVGCGEEVYHAPPVAEQVAAEEGIGIWRPGTDTVLMETIRGNVIDTPSGVVRTGTLLWSIESVEDLQSGVAGVWPDIDGRWVVVRVRLDYDTVGFDSSSAFHPRTVRLRQSLILRDSRGSRHVVNSVHDRIVPAADQPFLVPESGIVVPIIFALGRVDEPMALEIHDPLGSGEISWISVRRPSDWIAVNERLVLEDDALRALWDVQLLRVRLQDVAADSRGCEFFADVSLRNVTSGPAVAPDPSAARLYLGGGRTLPSVALSKRSIMGAGQTTGLRLHFLAVPRREALTLILDFGDRSISLNALPGNLPEHVVSMGIPVIGDGVRAAVYGARRTADGGMSIRVGLTNNGASPLVTSGITVQGRHVDGTATVPAIMRDAPVMLYPGFEERRWVDCASPIAFMILAVPGRSAITLPL